MIFQRNSRRVESKCRRILQGTKATERGREEKNSAASAD